MARDARRPDPPPLRTDDVRTVAVGTALWALALAGTLVFWNRLEDSGRLWWVGTCACGVALGLMGLAYVRRRAAAIARDDARDTAASGARVGEAG